MADEPSDPRQAAPLGAERDVQCVELKPVALTAAAVSIDMQNPVPAPTTPDAAKKPAVGEPLWQPSDACVSDADIAAQMGQEKRFTIFYRHLFRNKIWLDTPGDELALTKESVEEFKQHLPFPIGEERTTLWPVVWAYFRFMWRRTQPHEVVLALIPPAQTYIYGRVIAFFTDLPSVELLVVYMAAWLVVWLTGTVVNYKWEIVMPAASQRYALRAVLFKQLMRLKGDSAVLAKWSPGRFQALLDEAGSAVNGVWMGFFSAVQSAITIVCLFVSCSVHFHLHAKAEAQDMIWVVFLVFLIPSVFFLLSPFLFFRLQSRKCEVEGSKRRWFQNYFSCGVNGVAHKLQEPKGAVWSAGNFVGEGTAMAGNSCGHDFALLNHRLNASAMLYRKQAFRAFFYDLASSINNDSVSFLLVWGLIVAWCFVAYSSNIKDVALAAVAIGGLTQMRAMSMALQSLLQGLTQGYLMLLDVKEILNCPDVLDAAPQDKEGGPGTAAGAAPQK